MRPTPALLLLLLTNCVHRYVPCNDTISCREQQLQRDAAFAREVAKEPPVMRLDVEPVSRLVFVDRQHQLVYALDAGGLVALDLLGGSERWRAAGVIGDSLWRVGKQLAVSTEGSKIPPSVWFIDPEQPAKPTSCKLELGPPKEADRIYLHLFDRAGQPYTYWTSMWSYDGGTPPSDEQEERERVSRGCGVARIDPRSCSLVRESLSTFLWDPPEGRHPEPCSISPLLDLPAAAASAPKFKSENAVLTLGAYQTALRVNSERMKDDGCLERTKLTLEAHNPAGELLWKHELADRTQNICGKP